MIPEKDPEKENTYDVNNDLTSEDDQNEDGFFAILVRISRF